MNGTLNDVASQFRFAVGNKAESTSTGANTGGSVDTLLSTGQPADGRAAITASIGESSGITTFQVQESDASGSGFADISGALITFADTGQARSSGISFNRSKRYLRSVQTNAEDAVVASSTFILAYKVV